MTLKILASRIIYGNKGCRTADPSYDPDEGGGRLVHQFNIAGRLRCLAADVKCPYKQPSEDAFSFCSYTIDAEPEEAFANAPTQRYTKQKPSN